MFSGGLRHFTLVLNRGCINNIAFVTVTQAESYMPEMPESKVGYKLYLTCKTQPWDTDADDSDAVFKILGTIPDPTAEPNRVVFTISDTQSYIDPTVPYFFDIVQTNDDGTNPQRLAIGQFTVIAGANNAQAGGEA